MPFQLQNRCATCVIDELSLQKAIQVLNWLSKFWQRPASSLLVLSLGALLERIMYSPHKKGRWNFVILSR